MKQFISEDELGKYIEWLQRRVSQVEEQIREIARRKLGEEDVAKHPDLIYLVTHLHKMDQKGELPESQIKDEL